jgi:cytochrome c oxidase subunit IV
MAGHVTSQRTYFAVFGALAVLTVLTAGVSFVHLPAPWHVIVALAIAFTKALLVVLFFMHVIHSSRLIWLVASAGLFWLGILFVLTFADYISRDWLGYPLSWPRSHIGPP